MLAIPRDNVKCALWDSVSMLMGSVSYVMDASPATPKNLPNVPVVSNLKSSTRPPKLVRPQHVKMIVVLIATSTVNVSIATLVTLPSKVTASSAKTAATHAKTAVLTHATMPNFASKVLSTSPPHQRASNIVALNVLPAALVAKLQT